MSMISGLLTRIFGSRNQRLLKQYQRRIERINSLEAQTAALTDEQLNLMKRYGNSLRLFFDMDGAGQKAARKSAEAALQKEISVSIVAIPSGKDAADMGKEDPERLKQAVAAAVPAPKYFLDATVAKHDRTTSDGKRRIVDEYAELLQAVKNPIERAHWIKELAREVGTEERIVAGAVNAAFAKQDRYTGPSAQPLVTPSVTPHVFGKRSELLREELIGLAYAEPAVRTVIESASVDADTKAWIAAHPLYFFIVQSGQGDPLSLIEDQALKNESSRLSFRALESPEVAGAPAEERTGIMIDMAKRYLDDLTGEVTKRERLIALERSIREARDRGDRDEEKRLLGEFAGISGEK